MRMKALLKGGKMRNYRILPMILFLGAVFLLPNCALTPKVDRMAVDTTVDISGRWNDADSRMVADEMIRDCLERPWLNRFSDSHGGRIPAVIVGMVRNRSHEHINVRTFVKDMEMALIDSGRVQFVASKGERGQIRGERLDMAAHASDETMKGPGEEIGADFMLIGTLNTIRDEAAGKAVMFYQVNLELVAMADNVKVWIGGKKIKKLIEKRRFKW